MTLHARRAVSTAAVLLLAGCGGGTSAPGPPNIVDMILVTSDATVFTGQTIPSDQIVVEVLDTAGAVVPDATITLQAPAGWTVHHDTLIAPATEGTGTVTVRATRANSYVQTSLQMSAVTDLKAHGPWTLEFGCQPSDTSYHVDSFTVVAKVDSLVHIAPPVAQSQSAIWRMFYAQDSVMLWHNGTAIGTTYSQNNVEIMPIPDTLIFSLPFDIYNQKANQAVRPSASVWKYVMPSLEWCRVVADGPGDYVTTARVATFSSP